MEILVRKPSEGEKNFMKRFPVWENETEHFDWFYEDNETCLIIEGQATVEYQGKKTSFGVGDLVFFPKGLSCVWHVSSKMKKYYR